jgi:hypothetical protein
MADAALFIGWGQVVRGREQRALELFNETMQYNAELQSKREIESFEVAVLEPHGGELNGFMLLRGDAEKLARLRNDPEFERRTARAQLVLEHVGVVGATIGGGLTRLMATYAEEVGQLKTAVTV